ncbi:3-oxoacyl-ACP synthase [Nocardia sp. BSTN01]|uniref:beta-ketoacyl synthase N-terminal-like domain-containing protein n=1 Tax=Nocardia sp. BSTN01 TaxID=2783665 RepID=UPI00188EDB4C|nr:beta-ketoacyl synthase N-terminal-like domain-containing protein [Nocardia sp. BSTN01]MBF4999578.1 3-oxoacyl-ACP synthase [Nocardia sp. BSTN01]
MKTIITAWDALSASGRGLDDHVGALGGDVTVGGGDEPRLVSGFDIEVALGRRGTRAMERSTGLAVETTGRLLDRVGLGRENRTPDADDELGIVLSVCDGTQAIVDFANDTWVYAKPYQVNPAKIPANLMNFHAGQCAIWHRLRGPNATVCGGPAGGLLALNYARRLQRGGHARTLLCGAVEEYSAARVKYEVAQSVTSEQRAFGEGCVVFLVESDRPKGASREPLADLLAVEFGAYTRLDTIDTALSECIRRALRRTDVKADKVRVVAPSPGVGLRGRAELAAISDVFGRIRLATSGLDALGDTGAAAAGFQIVELLIGPGEPGRIAMATTSDDEGRVGCALLRIW